MTTATKLPDCTVTIENRLDGTRRVMHLPIDVNEANESCIAVVRAIQFADRIDALEKYGPADADGHRESPLGVMLQKTPTSIRIVWWATGSVLEALEMFREVQTGGQDYEPC